MTRTTTTAYMGGGPMTGWGRISYRESAFRFYSTSIDSATFTQSTHSATIRGTGKKNGVTVTYVLDVADNGPATLDTFVLTLSDGTYLVVNLAPGEYLVQVEAPGFQRFERTVALELGARSRLDMILAVGWIGETVTVSGVVATIVRHGGVDDGTAVNVTALDPDTPPRV